MILYNMRNRGAFEYDKFALNILQISNAVNLTEIHELKESSVSENSLLEIAKNVDLLFHKTIGTSDQDGISDLVFYKMKRRK